MPLSNWLTPVYGLFWQSNIYDTLNFGPGKPIYCNKESNIPKLKVVKALLSNLDTVDSRHINFGLKQSAKQLSK